MDKLVFINANSISLKSSIIAMVEEDNECDDNISDRESDDSVSDEECDILISDEESGDSVISSSGAI